MKRSEVVLKMARYYTQKNCMVEQGYIDSMEFASDMLSIAEALGMLPPCRDADQKSSYGYARVYIWETENEKK